MNTQEVNTRLLFLLSGTIMVALVCWAVFSVQFHQQREQYEVQADEALRTVAQRLAAAQASLDALFGLYLASDEMDAALLTPFSEEILQDHSFIDSLQYLTYISHSEKPLFIEEMHESGFSQFSIKSLGREPGLTVNPDYYLVTSFVEPLTPSSARLMGMDWLANETVESAFQKAVTENASQLITAPQGLGKQRHLVLLRPTYFGRSVETDPARRIEQSSGMFVILLDWDRLTNFSNTEEDSRLPLEFSLLTESGEIFTPAQHESTSKKTTGIEAENIVLSVTAHYRQVPTRSMYIWVIISGLLSAILFSITTFELRSRYLLKRDKRRAQSELYKERERAEVALRSISDAVITTDTDDNINYMNPVAEQMLNCKLRDVRDRPLAEIIRLELQADGEAIANPIDFYIDMTQSNLRQTGIDIVLKIGKDRIPVNGNASSLLDSDSKLIGSMLILRDVSHEQELTSQLVYQASHDSLTGLFSRYEFEKRVTLLLSSASTANAEHAMCFLDLDQFKVINDSCGHVAGDELLRQLGRLLRNTVRKQDTLARLGGDEFGILMECCTLEQAYRTATNILEAVLDYQFLWDGKIFSVGVSVGLVAITEATGNFTEIFRQADAACYLAKDSGRNRIYAYHPDDAELATRHGEIQWVGRINQALDEDRFCLYAQPIVSLGNDDHRHYEILVRMIDEAGGIIPPGAFLPAAERYNLIEKLDSWVVSHTCAYLAKHTTIADQLDFVTINLSGPSLSDERFLESIFHIFRESGLSPEKICFEVTETAAISNLNSAIDFIKKLKAIGCQFALDDFGSGISSFGYLKNLPVDYLKIDGMFVKDIVEDPIDYAMVKSINEIGQVMGMKTIAEFVENDEIKMKLKTLGVNYAQGYGIGKPEPLESLALSSFQAKVSNLS